ncbi:MAG: tryptophan synthase subunit alpha [Clostridiales bacterium]|jgi:tryptophan synthase alpha chain|nr:tryptophan synthase subunit alpha [Clostridiales bacterium]
MSRIKNAFASGKAFIGFITGGDPSIGKTHEFIRQMIRGGVDLIEIGIPFSDPVAEGTVIQEANQRALASGATPKKLFGLVEEIRAESEIPIVFLTYLNPVYRIGYGEFFDRCAKAGVDGLIIPDLPFEEQVEVKSVSSGFGVDVISLVAPTSEGRIKKIASEAEGFVYIVSSMGVTGIRSEIKTDLKSIVSSVKSYSTVPVAVGFGINTPSQASSVAEIADGVIIGSAIVKIAAEYGGDAGEHIYEYVKSIKAAISLC